jgi:serine/threonine protein kinase
MKPANSTHPVDRSDSGPPGQGYRRALGLEDPDLLLSFIQPATLKALAAEGLTKIVPVDHGGYGVILKAQDEQTGQPRAVKVVRDSHLPQRMQVFERECKVLASTLLPTGIAPRYFTARTPASAQPFIVLEWIDGKKLSDWLNDQPSLSIAQRELVCRAIFATYARLHAANLIHRDVSLGNIMISANRVRLIDFGGAGRAAPGYLSRNTQSRVPTTEAFVSGPVLRDERKPSIPDEVHAVAKVCFTVLTGRLAVEFTTEQRKQLMKQKGCGADLISILLPRMEDPPIQLVQQSQAVEF